MCQELLFQEHRKYSENWQLSGLKSSDISEQCQATHLETAHNLNEQHCGSFRH